MNCLSFDQLGKNKEHSGKKKKRREKTDGYVSRLKDTNLRTKSSGVKMRAVDMNLFWWVHAENIVKGMRVD